MGQGSRKEVKQLIKKGTVKVNGTVIKDSDFKLDPESAEIEINGVATKYRKYIYLMMNKPDGVVSATFDNYDQTVVDLLYEEHRCFEPFPVGRLDKDTVGLLLLTNDGDLNHELISPKYHVDKVYYAEIDSALNEADIEAFNAGIVLDDGYKCLPGKLKILTSEENKATCEVTIQEGKFHQVKRMFLSLEKKVIYLKRISFGPISLDESLSEGYYRELKEDEVHALKVRS